MRGIAGHGFYHLGVHVSGLSYRRLLWMTATQVVQEMLGHANIRQTMDTYSHVLPNMQQQAAERMDAMLG
jgi:integrase